MTCKYELLGFLYGNEYISDADMKLSGESAVDVLGILTFMEEHYKEDVTLSSIAEQVHMSKTYVCRMFKRVAITACVNAVFNAKAAIPFPRWR